MCDRNSLELFAEASYRRIQIAVAVALLKSKPKNITAVEYVTTLQKKFAKHCEKNVIPAPEAKHCEKNVIPAPEAKHCEKNVIPAPEAKHCEKNVIPAPEVKHCEKNVIPAPEAKHCEKNVIPAPEAKHCEKNVIPAPEAKHCEKNVIPAPEAKHCEKNVIPAPEAKHCEKNVIPAPEAKHCEENVIPAPEAKQRTLFLEQELALAKLRTTLYGTNSNDSMPCTDNMTNNVASVENATSAASASTSDCVFDKDTSEDLSSVTETNLKFIQAILQLKSMINTHSSVTSTQLQNILMFMPDKYREGALWDNSSDTPDLFGFGNSPSRSQDIPYSNDSGFESFSSSSENISSNFLKYTIHSSDIDQVLHKSVISVITYLETCVLSDNFNVVENIVHTWTGSILEHAVNVLVELIDCVSVQDEVYNSCLVICFNFLKKIIENIGNVEVYVYTMFEHQCVVIAEMCNNIHLCVNTIDYILEVILLTSQKLNPDIDVVDEWKNIEKFYYLFHLLEILLKKHNLTQKSKCGEHETKQTPQTNVIELWKGSWISKTNKPTKNVQESFTKHILKWKGLLEDSLEILPEEYVNIAMYSLTCLLHIEKKHLCK